MSTTITDFDTEFAALLACWNSHQELRDQKASLTELWRSHRCLDEHRLVTSATR